MGLFLLLGKEGISFVLNVLSLTIKTSERGHKVVNEYLSLKFKSKILVRVKNLIFMYP